MDSDDRDFNVFMSFILGRIKLHFKIIKPFAETSKARSA
jgi:hypothetical protein